MRLAQLGVGAALSFVGIVVSGPVGCSQSPPQPAAREVMPTGSTAQAIQGGMPDGTAHPFAVGVCVDASGPGQCNEICSGSLILPNMVVTARHCVDNSPKIVDCTMNGGLGPSFGPSNGPMWVTTNNNLFQTTQGWHQVTSVSLPTDKHVCGNDIALLILADLVPASEAKPVIPGVQYAMTDFYMHPHRTLSAIGFGITGPNQNNAGTRRIRSPIDILCIPGDGIIPCPADFNANEFYSDDGTCEGDSGSSAFDAQSVTDNAPFTFGVLSRGGDNAGDAGQAATLCKGGLYTRLDKFRDLVVQTAATASNNWALYPKPVPDWTIYVPPPVDAGVDAAPPKKAPQGEGVACSANADCQSNVCADTGAGKACTVACDETVTPTTCQAGFVCKAAVCVQDVGGTPGQPAAAAAPASAATTTSGCSLSPTPGSAGSSGGPAGLLGIVTATALGLGARRRRAAAR
jgi:hypothetical protein